MGQNEQEKPKPGIVDTIIGFGIMFFIIGAVVWWIFTPSEPKAERYLPAEPSKKETITEVILDRAAKGTVSEIKMFPLVYDASISVDNNRKVIMMYLVMNAGTDKATALDTADSFIRIYSVLARHEGSGTSAPTKDSYGSLFDEYAILMGVAPANATND